MPRVSCDSHTTHAMCLCVTHTHTPDYKRWCSSNRHPWAKSRHKISKVLYIVTFLGKFTRALTFQNGAPARKAGHATLNPKTKPKT